MQQSNRIPRERYTSNAGKEANVERRESKASFGYFNANDDFVRVYSRKDIAGKPHTCRSKFPKSRRYWKCASARSERRLNKQSIKGDR